MKSSEIGGQAVIEGIMMRNGDEYAVAVRKPDGEIHVKTEHYEGISGKCGILSKIPFIRGIFKFADSMVLGIRTLMYSAEFFEEDEEEQKKELTAKGQETRKTGCMGNARYACVFSCICCCDLYDGSVFSVFIVQKCYSVIRNPDTAGGSGTDSDIYFISGTDFQNGRYTAHVHVSWCRA